MYSKLRNFSRFQRHFLFSSAFFLVSEIAQHWTHPFHKFCRRDTGSQPAAQDAGRHGKPFIIIARASAEERVRFCILCTIVNRKQPVHAEQHCVLPYVRTWETRWDVHCASGPVQKRTTPPKRSSSPTQTFYFKWSKMTRPSCHLFDSRLSDLTSTCASCDVVERQRVLSPQRDADAKFSHNGGPGSDEGARRQDSHRFVAARLHELCKRRTIVANSDNSLFVQRGTSLQSLFLTAETATTDAASLTALRAYATSTCLAETQVGSPEGIYCASSYGRQELWLPGFAPTKLCFIFLFSQEKNKRNL